MAYGHNNNNNKSNPSTSRKVIIHRKPSISETREENNNNYTDLNTVPATATSSDLKNNNNNSVTVYGENGSSSFQANVGPNGLYSMQPVQPNAQVKFKRYLSPPPQVSFSSQQYPQGKKKDFLLEQAFLWKVTHTIRKLITIAF